MRKRQKVVERQKEVKLRKNFFFTFIITILLWAGLTGIIYFTDPFETGSIIVFFLVLFFALFFTFSIIFVNSRRGFISGAGLTAFVILRYFGLGNILNFFLIFGICLTAEIYFLKK